MCKVALIHLVHIMKYVLRAVVDYRRDFIKLGVGC